MARDFLRIVACGSVDDGKSTLIGRLLAEAGRVPDDEREKISLFTNVPEYGVISMWDVNTIYKVPRVLHEQGLDQLICTKLQLNTKSTDLKRWDTLVNEDLTNLEARYLMDGLKFNGDELDAFTDEYFRVAPALWDRLTNEMAQRTLEGMYPRWDVTAGAVEKANALLNGDAPAGLKRVIAEGQDRIARAVRNREVDATSA